MAPAFGVLVDKAKKDWLSHEFGNIPDDWVEDFRAKAGGFSDGFAIEGIEANEGVGVLSARDGELDLGGGEFKNG